MTLFQDVGEFHEKFELPSLEDGRRPATIDDKMFNYRTAFMMEELREFIETHARGDVAGAADALADLVWVALGTAHYMGIPFDAIWAEVKRANMEKRKWQEGDPIKPRNVTTSGEVVKPEGWKGPRIHAVLDEYSRRLTRGEL